MWGCLGAVWKLYGQLHKLKQEFMSVQLPFRYYHSGMSSIKLDGFRALCSKCGQAMFSSYCKHDLLLSFLMNAPLLP